MVLFGILCVTALESGHQNLCILEMGHLDAHITRWSPWWYCSYDFSNSSQNLRTGQGTTN
jgi:hypothetical protein